MPEPILGSPLVASPGGYDEKDDDCAKKLMSAVLSGKVPMDWEEDHRIADSPKFRCLAEFDEVVAEVKTALENPDA
jgi:hypothetical protein